jgi:hypothetical protein
MGGYMRNPCSFFVADGLDLAAMQKGDDDEEDPLDAFMSAEVSRVQVKVHLIIH